MRRSFGWDLAAYGDSYSALTYGVRDDGSLTATILKCDPICCPQLEFTADLRSIVADEHKLLELCCSFADFIVDVPIDLGPLLQVVNRHSSCAPRYYWQLVRRPMDQALGGLTPLADRIGFPVARLANLLRTFKEETHVELNKTLFETYPAASLELIRRKNNKVQRVYDKYRWIYGLKATEPKNWPLWLREALTDHFREELKLTTADKLGKEDRPKFVDAVVDALAAQDDGDFFGVVKRGFESERLKLTRTDKPPYKGGAARYGQTGWVAKGKGWSDYCLADLLNALGFRADAGVDNLDADEFDSVMCSVVGCFPECNVPEGDLRRAVREGLAASNTIDGISEDDLIPSGYRVLGRWPENVSFLLKSEEFTHTSNLLHHLRGLSKIQ
jgi:hypothetical protein